MKAAFRLYRRNRTYDAQDNRSGQPQSLGTSDRSTAQRLLNARNKAAGMPGPNLAISRAYMAASDPHMPHRTWREVISDFIEGREPGPSRSLPDPGAGDRSGNGVQTKLRWFGDSGRDAAFTPLRLAYIT